MREGRKRKGFRKEIRTDAKMNEGLEIVLERTRFV